jgi:hypothetical protein
MDTCFLVQVFFIVHAHASLHYLLDLLFLYKCSTIMDDVSFPLNTLEDEIAIEEDNGACVRLLFRQCIEWK